MHAGDHNFDANQHREGTTPNRVQARELPSFVCASTALLAAVANVHRLRVLQQLVGREVAVTHLSDMVGLSLSAVSQHLGMLRRGGLVSTRRQGQTIYYTCSSSAVIQLLRTLAELYPG